MARDLSLEVKRMVIKHLSRSPLVTKIVPPERIYAMTTPSLPTWPFIRYGSPSPLPYEASCWDGMSSRITIHGFAESTPPGVYPSVPGEDMALDLAGRVQRSMAESFGSSAEDETGIVSCEWLSTRCIRESGEADRWHAIVDFNIVAIVAS